MIHDKFYTNKDVANYCISLLRKHISKCDTIIEPSAGAGAFIFDKTTHALDIEPEGEGIIKSNWFDVCLWEFGESICVYGNPPFGKRNVLTTQFIQHALNGGNVDVIAFVLPQVFNKHTLQAVFPTNWVLVESVELPKDSFTEDGKPYGINTVFQIWVRNSTLPNLRAIERTSFINEDFSIVLDPKIADLFILGAAPKVAKLPSEVTPTNRGYYLKSHIGIDNLKKKLYDVNWQGNSSANGGVAWLTKTEIMNNYERHHCDNRKQQSISRPI